MFLTGSSLGYEEADGRGDDPRIYEDDSNFRIHLLVCGEASGTCAEQSRWHQSQPVVQKHLMLRLAFINNMQASRCFGYASKTLNPKPLNAKPLNPKPNASSSSSSSSSPKLSGACLRDAADRGFWK